MRRRWHWKTTIVLAAKRIRGSAPQAKPEVSSEPVHELNSGIFQINARLFEQPQTDLNYRHGDDTFAVNH